MKTLKLSYSIISNWKQGRYEEAVGQYLGKPLPATDAMELGKLYDQRWNEHIEAHGTLPDELGGEPLVDPRVQRKYQVMIPFTDKYQILLRGVLDIEEPHRITDNKCGRTEAISYVDQTQLDYYSIFKPDISEGLYRCYNPYMNTLTVGVKYFSQETRDNTIEEIVTFAGEILDYLLANKLFIDYKESEKK